MSTNLGSFHISISFVAYSIYKELERLLYLYNAPFNVKKAREIIHNIYQIEVTLPDSGVKQKVLLQMDEEQQFLVNMIQNEISKSFGVTQRLSQENSEFVLAVYQKIQDLNLIERYIFILRIKSLRKEKIKQTDIKTAIKHYFKEFLK